MFETLNYLVELSVSIYFLCIYVLFVINVCEFIPMVDHSVYKDDEDYQPSTNNLDKEKSKSGVSINEDKAVKSKPGKKHGGSHKVPEGELGKANQSSSKSVVKKPSKQSSKTKVEAAPEAVAGSTTDDDVKTSEEEGATTDEEASPAGNAEDIQKEPVQGSKLISKSSLKSIGSKQSGKGGSKNGKDEGSPVKDGGPTAENEGSPVEDGGPTAENEGSPVKDGGPTAENETKDEANVEGMEAAGSSRKSENLSKSSVKTESKRESQSGVPKKSGSQTISDKAEAAATEEDNEGPTAEMDGAMVSVDVPNDPTKKPSKSPDGEEASEEPNENPTE